MYRIFSDTSTGRTRYHGSTDSLKIARFSVKEIEKAEYAKARIVYPEFRECTLNPNWRNDTIAFDCAAMSSIRPPR